MRPPRDSFNLREQVALEEALSQLNELGSVVDASMRPLAEQKEREETRNQQLAQLSKLFDGKPHYQRVAQDQSTLEALLRLSASLQAPSHQPAVPKPSTKPQAPPQAATEAAAIPQRAGFELMSAPVVSAQPKLSPKMGRSRILRPTQK